MPTLSRMTARSVVLSVLLGAHPAWASAAELVRLTSDFGIKETALRVAASLKTMTVQNLSAQPPFITKDGSTIHSILDRTNAPVQNQSLAEARVPDRAELFMREMPRILERS